MRTVRLICWTRLHPRRSRSRRANWNSGKNSPVPSTPVSPEEQLVVGGVPRQRPRQRAELSTKTALGSKGETACGASMWPAYSTPFPVKCQGSHARGRDSMTVKRIPIPRPLPIELTVAGYPIARPNPFKLVPNTHVRKKLRSTGNREQLLTNLPCNHLTIPKSNVILAADTMSCERPLVHGRAYGPQEEPRKTPVGQQFQGMSQDILKECASSPDKHTDHKSLVRTCETLATMQVRPNLQIQVSVHSATER